MIVLAFNSCAFASIEVLANAFRYRGIVFGFLLELLRCHAHPSNWKIRCRTHRTFWYMLVPTVLFKFALWDSSIFAHSFLKGSWSTSTHTWLVHVLLRFWVCLLVLRNTSAASPITTCCHSTNRWLLIIIFVLRVMELTVISLFALSRQKEFAEWLLWLPAKTSSTSEILISSASCRKSIACIFHLLIN